MLKNSMRGGGVYSLTGGLTMSAIFCDGMGRIGNAFGARARMGCSVLLPRYSSGAAAFSTGLRRSNQSGWRLLKMSRTPSAGFKRCCTRPPPFKGSHSRHLVPCEAVSTMAPEFPHPVTPSLYAHVVRQLPWKYLFISISYSHSLAPISYFYNYCLMVLSMLI